MNRLSLWGGAGACFVVVAFLLLVATSQARQDADNPLSAEAWQEVTDKVDLLEPSGLMPTLLPTIMHNQDILQLTDRQVAAFRAWRKANYSIMVHVMDEIITRMVEFRIASLSPGVTKARLLALQSEIQELQHRLLLIKLSCREIIMTTFTDEQWENFTFVVSDNPRLASLISQAETLSVEFKN